jgi:hypothetical protein
MTLGAGLNRARASEADPPSSLTWETGPFAGDLDVLGNIGLRLDATASASDTAWIVTLQDVAPDGTATDVTAGFLRASLHAVDESASETGAPSVPCTLPGHDDLPPCQRRHQQPQPSRRCVPAAPASRRRGAVMPGVRDCPPRRG